MSEKINGGTLTRAPRAHECPTPSIQSNGIQPGDRWACECGSEWTCKPGFDQREPDPWWECTRRVTWTPATTKSDQRSTSPEGK